MTAPRNEPDEDLAQRRRSAPWSVAPLLAEWSAPLVARERLRDLASFPTVDDLNARLGAPVRFVPQPARRERRQRTALYEYRAAVDGEVMTRPHNWHDLWNALVWASFPRAKLRLTQLLCAAQAEWIGAAPRLPGARLRAQDLLAMFDEGGVVAQGERLVWFGHALYEHRHLVPRQPLRGSLLRVAAAGPTASLDEVIAAALGEPAFLAARLPTIGWAGAGPG